MPDHPDVQTPGPRLGERKPLVPDSIERFIAAMIMAVLCLITFANVVVRYLTNVSFAFTEEYSVALMVVMTLVGASAAFAGDRHIRLTFLVERMARRNQMRLELAVLLVCLGLFVLVTALSARYVWDEYRFEVLSPGLGVPQWLYTAWLPILAAVICLRILGRFVRVARALM